MNRSEDRYRKWDLAGLALSAVCLVHCLALPIALVAAPSLAVWLGETETTVHWFLFVLAAGISGAALYAGVRRHGVWLVVTVGGVGLLVMAVAAAHLFGTALEAALTLVGAGILAFAHVVNLRLTALRSFQR
ncbi:MAG TPA: MerC domain-containing protein [Pseudomonadales bacterium]